MKAWARVFNAIKIIIYIPCYNVVTTQQNYIITQFQPKEVRLLTHLLQLLGAEGIEKYANMVSSYNKYKVGSLKTKRFTLQSSDPSHSSKKRVNYHHNFSKCSRLSHSIWLYRSCGRFLHGDWHFNYLSKL